jgi:hypothetical protein
LKRHWLSLYDCVTIPLPAEVWVLLGFRFTEFYLSDLSPRFTHKTQNGYLEGLTGWDEVCGWGEACG